MAQDREKVRDSNFELLRILAMFFIILYHLITYFVADQQPDVVFWKSIQYPLHIGVPLFILISGYYGICAKPKGVIHLLLLTFIYYTPLTFAKCMMDIPSGTDIWGVITLSIKDLIFSLRPLTKGPYWFISSYLWLYLFSPVINGFISDKNKNLYYLAAISGFIAVYMSLTKGDAALIDGKNLINFIFIYSIGRLIRLKEQPLKGAKTAAIVFAYIVFNASLLSFLSIGNVVTMPIVQRLFFSYSSIGLICNAILLFLIFSRMNFKSRCVNSIAASTFPMYLLHHQPLVFFSLIQPVVGYLLMCRLGITVTFLSLIAFTLCIMCATYIIHTALKPLVNNWENKIDATIRHYHK